MLFRICTATVAICTFCMAQPQRTPDLEIQRAAMKKLSFLAGKWAGEGRLLRGPDHWVTVSQTEYAYYKLDGLVLVIEGVGRSAADSTPLLQALAVISYDDASNSYRMRAFNDGRFLESEVKLFAADQGIEWGFAFGEVKTSSTLRITETGEWTEHAEITFGSRPAQKLMELRVRPRR